MVGDNFLETKGRDFAWWGHVMDTINSVGSILKSTMPIFKNAKMNKANVSILICFNHHTQRPMKTAHSVSVASKPSFVTLPKIYRVEGEIKG